MSAPRILVLRHYRERRSKCSLEPLAGRPGLELRKFHPGSEHEVDGYLLLDGEAEALGPADSGRPLLLLDSTWRLLPQMRRSLRGSYVARALPSTLETAYPRRSKLAPDPAGGLASVEALYAALRILGERDDSLLADYPWREDFLANCDAADLP